MDITLASGKVLSGDMLIRTVLRSDMSPIPVSLEATVRANDTTVRELAEGAVVSSGPAAHKFRIIKVVRSKQSVGVQGKDIYAALSFIAIFDACHKVAFVRPSAIIKENVSLGGIYGACGATVSIESDFVVKQFSCFVGGIPSYGIGKVLQEEGGTVCATRTGLKFIRLGDIFKLEPATTFESDTTEDVESGFLERHEVPSFFSLDPAGAIVLGDRAKVRAVQYMPRADLRVLTNMSRALVHRKVLRANYAPNLNAGQLFQIVSTKLAVITAAHVFENGTDGTANNQYSKFWLGSLEG